MTLEVSVFDVLKPIVGDTFAIGSCRYRVHSPPLRDNSGMLWKINAVGYEMPINIEVTDNINKIIESVNAEREKIELATVRALNKTAQWLRSEGIKRVSEERKIPKKAIRKKLSVDKANRKRLWSVVKLSSQWIGVAKLGNTKQTRIGAKVGNRMYEGAFKAVMKNGHIGIFRRKYVTSLPIDEIKINSGACEIIKELAESKVEGAFEKYFHQQMNYMMK